MPQTDNLALWIATATALISAIAAIITAWRKPKLDHAQAASAMVNSDSVKQVIEEKSEAAADRHLLRALDMEDWGFNLVRPWARDVVVKFDRQNDQLVDLAHELGREIEPIHLLPFPEMPPPRPI